MSCMRVKCNLDFKNCLYSIRILYCGLKLFLLARVFPSTIQGTFDQNPVLRLTDVNFPRKKKIVHVYK